MSEATATRVDHFDCWLLSRYTNFVPKVRKMANAGRLILHFLGHRRSGKRRLRRVRRDEARRLH